MILEYSSTFELVALADFHTKLMISINEILRRRMSKKEVIFKDPERSFPHQSYDSDDCITIRCFPTASKLLKYFGASIRSTTMEIFHDNAMHQLVNLYCSDTLIHLTVVDYQSDVFGNFKRPFKMVQNLTLDGTISGLNRSNLSFNATFPLLRRLHLRDRLSELSLSHEKTPNLQELVIDKGNYDIDWLENFIKNNPQIESLKMSFLSLEFLQIVANVLPNIECLDFQFYVQNVDISSFRFSFPNLKRFHLRQSHGVLPLNMTFGELIELNINAMERDANEYIELALNHKRTLQKLRLSLLLYDADVLRLAKADLNVTDIEFYCAANVNAASIIELFESCKNLKKSIIRYEWVNLRWRNRYSITVLDELKSRFADDWTVTRLPYEITIERNDVNVIA